MTVECAVGDLDDGLVARLSGRLALDDTAKVRVDLLKCLAEQPSALFVDLGALTVTDPLAMSIFLAVVRQAARWPGIPVLFCAPEPDTAALLAGGAYRRLTAFDSIDAARDHLGNGGHGLPGIVETLLPLAGAARRGRDVVTDACLRWDLPALIDPASLICSELISNAVHHAGTMMQLRMSLSAAYLLIAVRDGSPVEPHLSGPVPDVTTVRGRGLHIIAATAHSWGSVPATDGKVVWASLSI
ncbi:ATPase [Actinoplanes sp. NPDC026623]|uniref:ATPase n=1 Tax=Actinoplanes sp. NPDC026623 TaxID=3155610 RepID=UPI0033E08D20